MASYQDIDQRLKVVEDKLAFCMKISKATIQVGSNLDPLNPPRILQVPFDTLYREMKFAGGEVIDAESLPVEQVEEAVDPAITEDIAKVE